MDHHHHDHGEEDSFGGKSIRGMLTGVVLQVTTRFDNYYAYDVRMKKTVTDGKAEYELEGGYAVDLFLYLQALLNFTFVLRPDAYPTFDEEYVKNTSVNFYLASYSLLMDRAKVLEPTAVTGQSKIYAFMDHVFESDSGQNIFINPFTPNLWLCTGVMMIIFMMSFLILNLFEQDNSAGDIIFHCVSLALQKGSDFPSFHDSTRFAALVLSTAVVIIMASYSGIMTSIFAISRYSITNMEALIYSNYKVLLETGSRSNGSIKYMLNALASNHPTVRSLIRRIDRADFNFVSFGDAIMQVKKHPSTYIIDEETVLDTISEVLGGFPCTWSKIPVFSLKYPWCMYMQKNASFQTGINLGIVRARERGILRRIRKRWINDPSSACADGSDGSFVTIKYSQIQAALQLTLIVVLVVAPLLLLLEKFTTVILSYKKERENGRKLFKEAMQEDRIFTKVLVKEDGGIVKITNLYYS